VTSARNLSKLVLIAGSALVVTWYAVGQSESPPSRLDLSAFRLTFNEDFNSLDVSARGPGSRWTAHTPWNGDFGDAVFSDPVPGFPFTIQDGVLRIEAKKDPEGKWRSGLLTSQDAHHNGFGQMFGYFEMRAKLPPGPGVWPAFWLTGNIREDASIEIDAMEYHGQFPDVFESWVHVWPKPGNESIAAHQGQTIKVPPGVTALSEAFHRYGVLVERDWITVYLDDMPMWRTRSPPQVEQPLFILVNLALGSGFPIDQTRNPSHMYVDYIRAYARKSAR